MTKPGGNSASISGSDQATCLVNEVNGLTWHGEARGGTVHPKHRPSNHRPPCQAGSDLVSSLRLTTPVPCHGHQWVGPLKLWHTRNKISWCPGPSKTGGFLSSDGKEQPIRWSDAVSFAMKVYDYGSLLVKHHVTKRMLNDVELRKTLIQAFSCQ